MAQARFLKAGSTLGFGYLVEHAMLFLRVLLVARFLGPEYFGISVTFLLVVSTFTLISDLGIEKYLIQARESELPDAAPTLATMLLVRGLLMGALIFVLSDWIAGLFGNPEIGWFYACAAIVPVIEGFRHLDPLSQQRQMKFAPYVTMQLGGLVPGVLLTVALAWYTESYLAIAVGCVATAVISVALSHLLARTRYRLGFHRQAARALLLFGWPLLLNGMVIFLATQGDRIVIGTMGGMRELAGYAAVAAVTAGASTFLSRLCGNLFLPLMSEARDDEALYAERSRTTAAAYLLLISASLVPLATLGSPLVFFLFGAEYRTEPLLTTFLALVGASVVLRSWCVVIALSRSGTGDILSANVLRISGLVAASFALAHGGGVVAVAACMCAGDVAATLFFFWRIGKRAPAARPASVFLGLSFAVLVAALVAINEAIDPFTYPVLALAATLATSLGGVATAMLVSPDLRSRIRALAITISNKLHRRPQ